MGQSTLYLKALDRDRKRPQATALIGALLCCTQDDPVGGGLEAAKSRPHMSPSAKPG